MNCGSRQCGNNRMVYLASLFSSPPNNVSGFGSGRDQRVEAIAFCRQQKLVIVTWKVKIFPCFQSVSISLTSKNMRPGLGTTRSFPCFQSANKERNDERNVFCHLLNWWHHFLLRHVVFRGTSKRIRILKRHVVLAWFLNPLRWHLALSLGSFRDVSYLSCLDLAAPLNSRSTLLLPSLRQTNYCLQDALQSRWLEA